VNLNSELFIGTVKALAERSTKRTRTRGALRARQPVRRSSRQADGAGQEGDLRGPHPSLSTTSARWHRGQDPAQAGALTDEEYTVMKQHPNKDTRCCRSQADEGHHPGGPIPPRRWTGRLSDGAEGRTDSHGGADRGDRRRVRPMTTNRPYQKAMPFDKAIARLFELSDPPTTAASWPRSQNRNKAGAFRSRPRRPLPGTVTKIHRASFSIWTGPSLAVESVWRQHPRAAGAVGTRGAAAPAAFDRGEISYEEFCAATPPTGKGWPNGLEGHH